MVDTARVSEPDTTRVSRRIHGYGHAQLMRAGRRGPVVAGRSCGPARTGRVWEGARLVPPPISNGKGVAQPPTERGGGPVTLGKWANEFTTQPGTQRDATGDHICVRHSEDRREIRVASAERRWHSTCALWRA